MSVFAEAITTHKSTYRGYDIVVVLRERRSEYFYCGYVRLPEDHILYGATFDDYLYVNTRLEVHGLVNFFGKLDVSEGYYLGFDCNHVGDDPEIQDDVYTLKECKRMVDQLIDVDDMANSAEDKMSTITVKEFIDSAQEDKYKLIECAINKDEKYEFTKNCLLAMLAEQRKEIRNAYDAFVCDNLSQADFEERW